VSESIKITWNPEAATASAPASATRDLQFSGDFRPASLRQSALPQARSYQSRVQALARSLNAFAWPDSGLVHGRSIELDPRLEGKVTASLPETARPFERFVSRGFAPTSRSTLDAGEYRFELAMGGKTEKLSVTLTGAETNEQVLDKVMAALNSADIPVQAQSQYQSSPGQRVEQSLATGQILVVGLNPGLTAGEPTLRDTQGHLLKALGLDPVPVSTEPAHIAVHTLRGDLTATVTSFSSKTLDPGAASGLAAGTYTLNWAMGPDSGMVTVDVAAGDTWRAVLERLASRLNMEQTRFSAGTAERERTVYTEDGQVLRTTGLGLDITAGLTAPGEHLSLSGADAASQNMLAALGLNATAQPGKDGKMVVDGDTQTRQPGIFDADQGHVRMTLQETFGETLPLRVTESLDRLEQGLSDVVTAYNGLRDLLTRQEQDYLPGLGRDWRQPLRDRPGLRGLGLRESGPENTLWLDAGAFYTALGRDPEGVQALLSGPDGLLTSWTAMAARDLDEDPERFLARETLPAPAPLDEMNLERGRRLVDLLERGDSREATALKDSGTLVDERG
jgi:hypothetical protein